MLTTTEKAILNVESPTNQQLDLGTEIYDASASGLYYLPANITADATGGKAITVPFACEIMDVIVQSRATSGSGTVTIKSGANAITDAIIMAVDTTMTRAGTINDAYSTLATTDTITAVTNGATDFGYVMLVVRKV